MALVSRGREVAERSWMKMWEDVRQVRYSDTTATFMDRERMNVCGETVGKRS